MRLSCTIVVVTLLVGGNVLAQKPPGKKPSEVKPTIEGEVGKNLDERMRRVDKDEGGFCGNVLVSVGGKVLLEKGYGIAFNVSKTPMPLDAMYDWASVSKQITAAAILRLQDKKKLKIDDPVKKYYPEVCKEQSEVTIRQLLNHTSGIEAGFKNEWKFDAFDRASFEKMHCGLKTVKKPGEAWEYNNSAYAFLAALVERVTKKTFEDFCVEELYKPAGMKDAAFIGMEKLDLTRVPKINRGEGFKDNPDFLFAYGNKMSWGYRGCGGAVMSTREMYLWDRALRGEKVLSKAAKEEYYKPALSNYALGWTVKKEKQGLVASHSGGVRGVVAYLERGLDEDYCIEIVFSYEPKTRAEELAADLLKIAKDG